MMQLIFCSEAFGRRDLRRKALRRGGEPELQDALPVLQLDMADELMKRPCGALRSSFRCREGLENVSRSWFPRRPRRCFRLSVREATRNEVEPRRGAESKELEAIFRRGCGPQHLHVAQKWRENEGSLSFSIASCLFYGLSTP